MVILLWLHVHIHAALVINVLLAERRHQKKFDLIKLDIFQIMLEYVKLVL